MDTKIRGELPSMVHDEVRGFKAMLEEDFSENYRRGLVKERVTSIESGDWKRPQIGGLQRTQLRVRPDVLENRKFVKWSGLILMKLVSV